MASLTKAHAPAGATSTGRAHRHLGPSATSPPSTAKSAADSKAPGLRGSILAVLDSQMKDLGSGDKELLVGHLRTQLESMDPQEREESLGELSSNSKEEWGAALAELQEAQSAPSATAS